MNRVYEWIAAKEKKYLLQGSLTRILYLQKEARPVKLALISLNDY